MNKKKLGLVESMMHSHRIVYLVIVLLIAYGVYGLAGMNKQEFPEFTIREGIVAAAYPGATPEEMEMQVTKPLENFLYTYPEVNKEKTYSYTQNGIVYVFVSLEKSVKNKTEVWSKIRHGLKDFKAKLPSGVVALVVNDDFGNTSSLLITIQSKDKTYRELHQCMDELCDRLRTVKAVGNIKVYGEQREVINVYIDQEKLATYGISNKTLMAELFTQGLLPTGGSVDNGDEIIPIHIHSPLSDEKEIGEQIVYSDPLGHVIRLKDVARIQREYEKPSSFIRKDGENALVLSVEMQPGNNIVTFGKRIEKQLAAFQRTLPEDVQLYRITDLPHVVGKSVYSFLRDLLVAILVVVVVMLMFFPIRSALITASSIPITITMTWALMYALKMEINTVTLASLIVVLGMIVDNAIVIIDGYIHNTEHGMSPKEAAIQSANTYFEPLLVATLAMALAFFPFMFTMTGPIGEFVQHFPWPFTFALLLSLLVAVLLTPYWASKYIPQSRPEKSLGKVAQWQNNFFKRLQGSYEWLLEKCFRHPYLTLGIGVGSILISVYLFLFHTNIQMMPLAERDSFALEVRLPEGSALAQTAAVCDSLESMLSTDRDIEAITVFYGSGSPRFMTTYAPSLPGENYAQFIVNTRSVHATERVLAKYSNALEHHFPNALLRFKHLDYQTAKNAIEIRLKGDNTERLRDYADTLTAFLHTLDDQLTWIHTDFDGYRAYADITLDPVEASRLGITQTTLGLSLASQYGGTPLTTLWEGSYAIPVRLKTDRSEEGENITGLEKEMVPTILPGTWVPLRQIAGVTPRWEPVRIVRRNGVHCLTVSADLRYGKSQPEVMKKIKHYMRHDFAPNLPEDVEWAYGGLEETNMELLPEIVSGLILMILLIFFCLVYALKKISLALLSLFSTLLCLLGAIIGLKIFHIDFGITSILGIVSLVGIVVRNAIIMFQYAEERIKEGMTVREAAHEAGKRRMRPIFLTCACAAAGVIPMIISRSTLWMPMGVIICFGMIFSFILIVCVLPIAYWKIFEENERINQRKAAAKATLPLIGLALLCAPVQLHAQNTPDETLRLSLDSCKALAMRNQKEMKNSQLAIDAAKETKKAAFTKYFPTVSASASAFKMADPLLDIQSERDDAEIHAEVKYKGGDLSGLLDDLAASSPLLGNLLKSMDFSSITSNLSAEAEIKAIDQGSVAMVTAIQPVFAGGRIVNGNRLASVGVEAAECQQILAGQNSLIAVEKNYWLIVSLTEKRKTLAALETLLDTLSRDVHTAYEAGVVTRTDVLKVQLKQNEIRSAKNTLENGIRLATMALCQSIGVPFQESVELTDSLQIEPDQLQTGFDLSESLRMRNEYRLLDLNVKAESLRAKMILGESLPQIGIGAAAFYYNIVGTDMGNACIFATANIPLSAWWENAHQYKKQQIQVRMAENKRQDLGEKMSLQMQQSANEVNRLRDELENSEETRQQAEENMKETQHYYEAGMVPLSDYLEAQSIWLNASSAVTDTKAALRTAYQQYLQACGREVR
ncbi:MAG: efflux RND transporter permease subunit [Bacteroidales bacterium]|nr:efflux RND transporter permease subunit [Bacteroidales bacterium]